MSNVIESWKKKLWDGVMFNYSPCLGVNIPVQIDLGLNWLEDENGDLVADIKWNLDIFNFLRPIPLTLDLLERTNFSKTEVENTYKYGEVSVRVCEGNRWYYNNSQSQTREIIRYFHELQYFSGTDTYLVEWCNIDVLFPRRMQLLLNKRTGNFIVV